jgi:hypothetical protein
MHKALDVRTASASRLAMTLVEMSGPDKAQTPHCAQCRRSMRLTHTESPYIANGTPTENYRCEGCGLVETLAAT